MTPEHIMKLIVKRTDAIRWTYFEPEQERSLGFGDFAPMVLPHNQAIKKMGKVLQKAKRIRQLDLFTKFHKKFVLREEFLLRNC